MFGPAKRRIEFETLVLPDDILVTSQYGQIIDDWRTGRELPREVPTGPIKEFLCPHSFELGIGSLCKKAFSQEATPICPRGSLSELTGLCEEKAEVAATAICPPGYGPYFHECLRQVSMPKARETMKSVTKEAKEVSYKPIALRCPFVTTTTKKTKTKKTKTKTKLKVDPEEDGTTTEPDVSTSSLSRIASEGTTTEPDISTSSLSKTAKDKPDISTSSLSKTTSEGTTTEPDISTSSLSKIASEGTTTEPDISTSSLSRIASEGTTAEPDIGTSLSVTGKESPIVGGHGSVDVVSGVSQRLVGRMLEETQTPLDIPVALSEKEDGLYFFEPETGVRWTCLDGSLPIVDCQAGSFPAMGLDNNNEPVASCNSIHYHEKTKVFLPCPPAWTSSIDGLNCFRNMTSPPSYICPEGFEVTGSNNWPTWWERHVQKMKVDPEKGVGTPVCVGTNVATPSYICEDGFKFHSEPRQCIKNVIVSPAIVDKSSGEVYPCFLTQGELGGCGLGGSISSDIDTRKGVRRGEPEVWEWEPAEVKESYF